MSKQLQINEDIKNGMKAKDQPLVDVLRQLKNAFTNAALSTGNAGNELSDEAVISVIRKQIKQREDSVEQFSKGGRAELAEKETNEITVLKTYLPQEMTADEIDAVVKQAIADTGAVTKKDMGKAIKRAVELAEGRVDNKTISMKMAQSLS
jgi:uncharacterized protein YqeY